MCFSAKASFIAAGTLSLIGLLSIKTAKNIPSKKILPFAATPFIFAIQQACEGIIWISLTTGLPVIFYNISMYSFIFFAVIWWPLWTPTTLYLIEQNRTRQKLLLITFLFGIATCLMYAMSLLTQPAQTLIINHHLYYPTISYPFASKTGLARFFENSLIYVYTIATIAPFFLSSVRFTWILGIIMSISGIISLQLYTPTSASVWCYFAALASIMVYIIVRYQKR